MTDFYSSGLATGNMIGNMVNPGSSGREAYLQANKRETVKKELANISYGIEERDGQIIVTPQAEAVFDDPLYLRLAISKYGENKTKAHKEALEIDEKQFKMVQEVIKFYDKTQSDIDADENIPPQMKLTYKKNALERLGSVYEKVTPGIWTKYEMPRIIASKQGEATLADAHNNVSIALLNEIQEKIRKDPKNVTLEMQHDYTLFRNSLPEKMRDMFLKTEEQFKNTPPREIVAGDMARKRQETGIQEGKERRMLGAQEEKEKRMTDYRAKVERPMNIAVAKREAMNVRKEFNALPEVKDFSQVRQKYDVMSEAMKESKKTNNFVAVDQAIITLFNKMTDPESVVRESEYARTAEDLALVNRLKGKVAKLKAGGAGLTQDDREAIYRMAGKFREASDKKYRERLHEYKGYISNYGVDPNEYLNPAAGEKTVVETRVERDGTKLLRYSDGSVEEVKP